MSGIGKRGKKYAGQDRWERDLADIQRVTDAPRVGKVGNRPVEIGGKPVHFDSVLLLDLLRRRENGTENDGLRSRAYDQGGGGGSSAHTQTEAAALRGLPEKAHDEVGNVLTDDWSRHEQPDPVGVIVQECLDCLDTMARASRQFEKKLELILNAGSVIRGRQTTLTECLACKKTVTGVGDDRIKSGYGPCCYTAFRRWVAQQDYDGMDASHVTFQKLRLAEMDAREAVELDAAANA